MKSKIEMSDNSGSLTVFTGLPASGKTTTLINTLTQAKTSGKEVALFLSNEHYERSFTHT